jgi:hypothetical protein
MATATLLDNISAYDALRDVLETEHYGKWVLFHDRELIGGYDDFQDIANEAVTRFGRGPYLIRRVGAPPFVLPASVQYTPVYDNR